MEPLTDAEKLKLREFISTLNIDQILTTVMVYLPGIVAAGQFNPAPFLAYLSSKSVFLQTRLDSLESVKAADEAALTAEKTIIDNLITKLGS